MRKHCFPDSFNVTCARDEVIVMTAARYGRMSKGQCLTSDYQVGCWADVLHHVDRKCSGRRHCVITIPDTVLHNLHPCQKDLFAYLESEHVCQKGIFLCNSLQLKFFLLFLTQLNSSFTVNARNCEFCARKCWFNGRQDMWHSVKLVRLRSFVGLCRCWVRLAYSPS